MAHQVDTTKLLIKLVERYRNAKVQKTKSNIYNLADANLSIQDFNIFVSVTSGSADWTKRIESPYLFVWEDETRGICIIQYKDGSGYNIIRKSFREIMDIAHRELDIPEDAWDYGFFEVIKLFPPPVAL